MKLFLLLLVIGLPTSGISQEGNVGEQKVYKVKVAHMRQRTSGGFLAAVKDSAIWLTPTASSIRFNANEPGNLEKVTYSDIDLVMIKRKGSTGKGLVFGALIGFSAGALSGLIMVAAIPCSTNNTSVNNYLGLSPAYCRAAKSEAGQKAIRYGSFGALTGGLAGALIGITARKRFIIGGRKDKYKEMQLSILELMYNKTPLIK